MAEEAEAALHSLAALAAVEYGVEDPGLQADSAAQDARQQAPAQAQKLRPLYVSRGQNRPRVPRVQQPVQPQQAQQQQTGHQQQQEERQARQLTSQQQQQQQQQPRHPLLQQEQQPQDGQLLQGHADAQTAAGGSGNYDAGLEADQHLAELADAGGGVAPPVASGISKHAQEQQRLQDSWEAKRPEIFLALVARHAVPCEATCACCAAPAVVHCSGCVVSAWGSFQLQAAA